MRTANNIILLLAIAFISANSFGQCVPDPVQGTQCAAPVKSTVKPGQSPTSFVDFSPATVQWPCLNAPSGFFRLCATNGQIAVDVGDGKGYLNLRGRDGIDGVDGIDGTAATISVGSVSSAGTPLVWNSGTQNDAVLNFALPKGDPGLAASITVGSVSSGFPVTVWNSGTPDAAVLNFVLQKGDKGLDGTPGVIVGNTLTGTLTCPKGRGTVQAGFTSTNCTIKISAITK